MRVYLFCYPIAVSDAIVCRRHHVLRLLGFSKICLTSKLAIHVIKIETELLPDVGPDGISDKTNELIMNFGGRYMQQ